MPHVEFVYNRIVHSATQYFLFEDIHGFNPLTPFKGVYRFNPLTLFEVVYRVNSLTPLDLLPLPISMHMIRKKQILFVIFMKRCMLTLRSGPLNMFNKLTRVVVT